MAYVAPPNLLAICHSESGTELSRSMYRYRSGARLRCLPFIWPNETGKASL